MSYCKYCGEELVQGNKHDCSKKPKFVRFLSAMFDKSGIENPLANRNEIYERGQKIIPDCIATDNGEVPVKQYDLAIFRSKLKLSKAEGRMQITNKRVLFRAAGFSPAGKTTYQQEFALDKIEGVEIRKDFRFRGLEMLFCWWISTFTIMLGTLFATLINLSANETIFFITAIIGIATCIPFFVIHKHYFIKFLISGVGLGAVIRCIKINADTENNFLAIFLIIAIIITGFFFIASMFLYCFKPNLRVEIKTSGGSPSIQIRHKYTSLFLWHKMDEYSGFSEVLPGKDADLAIKEIGAIINDIKTLGDFAIEKWQQN